MAHPLCAKCQQLSFKLHVTAACQSLGCNVKEYTYVDLHSEVIAHQATLSDLEESANHGCHLCTLLSTGLHSASRIPADHRDRFQNGVFLFLECETTGFWQIDETLTAACGHVMATFPSQMSLRYGAMTLNSLRRFLESLSMNSDKLNPGRCVFVATVMRLDQGPVRRVARSYLVTVYEVRTPRVPHALP
jgi:hypothetical protein